MAKASAFRYVKWHEKLIHINQRKHGVPDELLAFTNEYFGKSPAVQRYLGLDKSLKPETDTALAVMARLDRAGVVGRETRSKGKR